MCRWRFEGMPDPTENMALGYLTNIEDAVADDQIQDALNSLQDFVRDFAPQLRDDVLMLRRRFSKFRRDHNRNLTPPNEVDLIVRDLLDLARVAQKEAVM